MTGHLAGELKRQLDMVECIPPRLVPRTRPVSNTISQALPVKLSCWSLSPGLPSTSRENLSSEESPKAPTALSVVTHHSPAHTQSADEHWGVRHLLDTKSVSLATEAVCHGSPLCQTRALGDAEVAEGTDAILGDFVGGMFLRFIWATS